MPPRSPHAIVEGTATTTRSGAPMSRPSQPTLRTGPAARASRVAGLALAAVVALVLSLATGVVGSAAAAPLPEPTGVTVTASSDPTVLADLEGAPAGAVPAVLAAKGDTFLVSVRLTAGAGGGLDAAYRQDQVVTLSATGPGSLTPTTGTIPRGVTTAVFPVSYSAEATDVTVRAEAGRASSRISGTSNAFDVLRTLSFVPGDSASLRDGTAGADGAGCAVVDRANPFCARLQLSRGASSSVALSLGLCSSEAGCTRSSLVAQAIADLTAEGENLYTRTSPARMELICDKSECGKGGVTSFTARWSESAGGALSPVAACAAKDVIDGTLDYCTDYRSSTRDGAGDLHLVVLFVRDVRGGI